MTRSPHSLGYLQTFVGLMTVLGCSGSRAENPTDSGSGGLPQVSNSQQTSSSPGTSGLGGKQASNGSSKTGTRPSEGGAEPVGSSSEGSGGSGARSSANTTGTATSNGGTTSGVATNAGGKGGASSGVVSNSSTVSKGGSTAATFTKSLGGSSTGGATGGSSTGGSTTASNYPCGGSTSNYNAVATKSGDTWTVTNSGKQVYSGSNFQQALTAAYNSLSSGRTTKQSILVDGSGDIPATAQVPIPSYTILNVCGTLNVSGTPSGSDRSPLYARNARDIEIPNLKMTGSPQYGIFMRQTDNVHLGQIDLRLSSAAGIGIRVDSGPSASTMTTFNKNLTIDHVYGSGMGSHIVETYGISDIKIGTVEGANVGECGLLLNRSINAEIDSVSCEDCATGTGYAAFRIANDVGKVGSSYPAGNIHVKKVYARGGGRGIFSVSGSGGLTIDEIDIADTGSTPILLQNCYNTTIAAVKGTVSKGLVQLSNDTEDTNDGKFPPSENVTFSNLTLSNGASIRQDWCKEVGSNGCKATNITGGTVSMCP